MCNHVWKRVERGKAIEEFQEEFRCISCGARVFIETVVTMDLSAPLHRCNGQLAQMVFDKHNISRHGQARKAMNRLTRRR